MLGPKIHKITYDLPANISFPKMIRAHLEQGIASCSTGYDRGALKRALGEALERHVAFSGTENALMLKKLSEMEDIVKKWILKNICLKEDDPQLENHHFLTTKVTELPTGCEYYAPLVAFKLAQNPDYEIFGLRDSSGSALHQDRQLALQGSRDEFCERQALTLFWYFGHCISCLDLGTNEKYKKLYSNLKFIGPLLSSGRILIFDISLFKPVRTVLSVYLSESGSVKFAAGASGTSNLYEAVEKSLLEMYQAYVLMLNVTDSRCKNLIEVNDPIIKGYLNHNCQETVNKFNIIFNAKNNQLNDLSATINFKMDFNQEPVFLYEEKIIFTDKKVHFFVMKSIHGFKTMSLDDKLKAANLSAARHYGYNTQVNKGSIPFA